jgi:hypothetical protein
MQELQVKTFDTFNDDHQTFIKKMNKSKILANKIKDNINLIDNMI